MVILTPLKGEVNLKKALGLVLNHVGVLWEFVALIGKFETACMHQIPTESYVHDFSINFIGKC